LGWLSYYLLLPVAYVDYFLATQGLMIATGAVTTFTQDLPDLWSRIPYLYWSVAPMATFAVLYLLLSRDEFREERPA